MIAITQKKNNYRFVITPDFHYLCTSFLPVLYSQTENYPRAEVWQEGNKYI